MVVFVNDFLMGNLEDPYSKDVVVVLIPKVQNAISIENFRPFILCNVFYKIASKSLANRLKVLLPNVVSETHSAFVPNNLITDNAIVALKTFHTMKKGRMTRRVSCQ